MTVYEFNLKEYRKNNGLTQVALAEKLGVDQSMISVYEKKWETVKMSTRINICKKLGLNEIVGV